MTITDLSHPLHPGMPVYPGTEPPTFVAATTIARDGFAELRVAMHTHTGTHLDAPCHILPRAASLDQFPAAHFVGRAVLIDARAVAHGEIGMAHLAPYAEQLAGADYVMLHTGWSQYWGQARYFQDFPTLSVAAAEWLAGRRLKGLALDAISVDAVTSVDLPVHRVLLGAGMVIVENLTNLAALTTAEFTFVCLPLKLRGADGSPVRAIALTGPPA